MLFDTAVREDGSIFLPSSTSLASIFMLCVRGLAAGCWMASEVCAASGACTELAVSRSLLA